MPLRVIDSVECRAFARNEAIQRAVISLELFSCSVVSLEYEVAKAHGHGLYRPSLAGVEVKKLQILLHKLGWRHDFHVCGISITIVAQIDGNERITLGL